MARPPPTGLPQSQCPPVPQPFSLRISSPAVYLRSAATAVSVAEPELPVPWSYRKTCSRESAREQGRLNRRRYRMVPRLWALWISCRTGLWRKRCRYAEWYRRGSLPESLIDRVSFPEWNSSLYCRKKLLGYSRPSWSLSTILTQRLKQVFCFQLQYERVWHS